MLERADGGPAEPQMWRPPTSPQISSLCFEKDTDLAAASSSLRGWAGTAWLLERKRHGAMTVSICGILT